MRGYVKLYAAAAVTIAAAIVAVTQPAQATNPHDDGADVIVDWDQLAQRTIVANQPFAQVRQFAMLHIAMADSVIAIEGRYEPFKCRLGRRAARRQKRRPRRPRTTCSFTSRRPAWLRLIPSSQRISTPSPPGRGGSVYRWARRSPLRS